MLKKIIYVVALAFSIPAHAADKAPACEQRFGMGVTIDYDVRDKTIFAAHVTNASPAQQAGLRDRDKIIAFNSVLVSSFPDNNGALDAFIVAGKTQERVVLEVLRKSEPEQQITVTPSMHCPNDGLLVLIAMPPLESSEEPSVILAIDARDIILLPEKEQKK